MKYIALSVRTAKVVHGYDADNHVIEETITDDTFMTKLITIDRIQSISEQYLLVTSSHGRVMYWEYDNTLDELSAKLDQHALLL